MFGETFSSLQHRNFRLFFWGQLLSSTGAWITTVAITLLVLHRTGSGADVGLLAASQFGPILFLSAWAGVIADRYSKRRTLYVTQSLEMVQSATLAALAFWPNSPTWAFFLTSIFGGCLLAVDQPVRRSFVREMVSHERVTNAVGLYSAMVNLSRTLGPALGGLLIEVAGYGWCFAVDASSYVLVLVALAAMRPDELRPSPPLARARGQIREGLRYVWATPSLRTAFLMLLIVGTFSYNFTVTFPLLVERSLDGSGPTYTYVYSAFSVGALAGTMVVARRRVVGDHFLVVSAAFFGIAMLALSATPNVAIAYPLAALVGASSVAYITSTTTVAQVRAAPHLVGRVLALQTILQFGTTPVGGPLLGTLADAAGGRAPIVAGGIGALAAAALGSWHEISQRRAALRGSRPDPARDDPDVDPHNDVDPHGDESRT